MDIKVGGAMRGMCRDKGGASICAGNNFYYLISF